MILNTAAISFCFLARCLNVAAGIVMQGFGRPVFKQPSAQTHQARRPNCRGGTWGGFARRDGNQ
jgi:hypothetical protein